MVLVELYSGRLDGEYFTCGLKYLYLERDS